MRGVMRGWPSQATICASARTRARPLASLGRSGGSGCASSRYSMIAMDSNRVEPSSRTSAGTTACAFTARYSGLQLLALHQVDGDLFRLYALQRERDAHAAGGERAPEAVILYCHFSPPIKNL